MKKKTIGLYVLETIISILFGIFLFQFGSSRKLYWVILAFIMFCSLGYLIYYLYKQNSKKLEHVFLLLAIPIGILYSLFLSPYRIMDDTAHLVKNIDLSQGHLITRKDSSNVAIMEVPKTVNSNLRLYVGDFKKMTALLEDRTDYKNLYRIENAFTYTAINMPTNYMVSSLGFKIGSLFNLNIYISAYLAKLFNLIFFFIVGYIMIKIFPFHKMFLLVYLFNPMMLQSFASIGADCFTNLICLLWISYILYLRFDKKIVEKKDTLWLFILMLLLATAKFIYFPLLLLLCLLRKCYKTKNDRKTVLLSVFLALIVGFIGIYIGLGYECEFATEVSGYEIDTVGQIKNLFTRPWDFVIAVMMTIYKRQGDFFCEFFGRILGSYHISLFFIPYVLYIGLFFVSLFMEHKEDLKKAGKYLILIMSAILILCVFGVEYLTWNPVGGHFISGIQGRYFLPFMILPLLLLSTDKIKVKFKDNTKIVTCLLLLIHLLNIFVLFRSFM